MPYNYGGYGRPRNSPRRLLLREGSDIEVARRGGRGRGGYYPPPVPLSRRRGRNDTGADGREEGETGAYFPQDWASLTLRGFDTQPRAEGHDPRLGVGGGGGRGGEGTGGDGGGGEGGGLAAFFFFSSSSSFFISPFPFLIFRQPPQLVTPFPPAPSNPRSPPTRPDPTSSTDESFRPFFELRNNEVTGGVFLLRHTVGGGEGEVSVWTP